MVILVILQVVLLPHFSLHGIKPNLVLLVVVVWSLMYGAREGSIWALMCGILLDLLSGAPLGAASLALLVAGLLAGLRLWRTIHAQWFLPALVAAASVAHDLVLMLLLQIGGHPLIWWDDLLRVVLPGALLSGGLAVLAYPLVRRMPSRPEAEEEASSAAPRQPVLW
ncbi:MAG: rod shape-determining protein MreD [Chloroflexi bacterium]|nr:rod shape-determining protein MreD [Chloroflexota bacterium]